MPVADRAHRPRPARPAASTTALFAAGCGARHTEVKRALLDQSLISGIGNIYADEALWRARLHGERPTGDADPGRGRRPARATSATCSRDALRAGGTSFDALYVNVNGQSGYFDRSLAVYGREGEPCPRCGTADPPGRVHEPLELLLPALPAAAPAPAGRHDSPGTAGGWLTRQGAGGTMG